MWKAFAIMTAAGAGAFLLSACQTMSAEECKVADWRALGFSDGAGGNYRFNDRQEDCARRGFASDLDAYRVGNAEGIRQYCTPFNGFRRGLGGASYNGFCPPDLHEGFMVAHADGYRAYQANYALQQAESERNRLEGQRNNIDGDIRSNEDALAAATTDEERRRIRNELGRLNDERRRVNDDIRVQLREIALRTDAVERVRFDIGPIYGAW